MTNKVYMYCNKITDLVNLTLIIFIILLIIVHVSKSFIYYFLLLGIRLGDISVGSYIHLTTFQTFPLFQSINSMFSYKLILYHSERLGCSLFKYLLWVI